jgi:hypothetical protein
MDSPSRKVSAPFELLENLWKTSTKLGKPLAKLNFIAAHSSFANHRNRGDIQKLMLDQFPRIPLQE